jgi:hypothetical protein
MSGLVVVAREADHDALQGFRANVGLKGGALVAVPAHGLRGVEAKLVSNPARATRR